MGLLAGISVFSIIELGLTILKWLRFAACNSKIAPETVWRPRPRKEFSVNKEHIFYHLAQNFGKLLKESNVHGVHYTTNKNLRAIERTFWFITITVLLAFCSVLVFDSLKELQSNSVIFEIDEQTWNVEDVRNLSFDNNVK